MLRWICPKRKQEWILVGLLTFTSLIMQVFLKLLKRHCSYFQVLQPSGYNRKKENTTWKGLQAPTPKDNTEYIYITSSSLRSPTACLFFCFTLLPQREINYSKPRKTGYVRTPNDIQIPSTLASSHTSHLSQGGEYTQLRLDEGTYFLL